jgi:uncharacterized OsmC-like protein
LQKQGWSFNEFPTAISLVYKQSVNPKNQQHRIKPKPSQNIPRSFLSLHMKITASIDSRLNEHKVAVQTNDNVQQITISPKSSGFGSSVNGGELLLLALATCFCNDIYREALKRNIKVHAVQVECEAAFGAEGEPGSVFQYKAHVEADASPELIAALIKDTDQIAEIHNTLRKGVPIQLVN